MTAELTIEQEMEIAWREHDREEAELEGVETNTPATEVSHRNGDENNKNDNQTT